MHPQLQSLFMLPSNLKTICFDRSHMAVFNRYKNSLLVSAYLTRGKGKGKKTLHLFADRTHCLHKGCPMYECSRTTCPCWCSPWGCTSRVMGPWPAYHIDVPLLHHAALASPRAAQTVLRLPAPWGRHRIQKLGGGGRRHRA